MYIFEKSLRKLEGIYVKSSSERYFKIYYHPDIYSLLLKTKKVAKRWPGCVTIV